MATGPRSKAASICNNGRTWSVREALLAGLICLLLASLALLHHYTGQAEDPPMQLTPKVAGSKPYLPEVASSSTSWTSPQSSPDRLEPALESAESDLSAELLRLALTDSDATVRLRAVSALADIDDERAGKMLATIVIQDQDVAVREEAVSALSERRGAADIQALEQALMDPNSRVREAAIEAFVTIGGESAAQALSTLVHIGDVSSRLQAVDALGEIGGDISAESLREALMDENDAVRESAAELALPRQNESE